VVFVKKTLKVLNCPVLTLVYNPHISGSDVRHHSPLLYHYYMPIITSNETNDE